MKSVLISRYGAFGDVLHATHLPRLFKESGYDKVDFETNHKGYQILVENPYIDNLIHMDPASKQIVKQMTMGEIQRHWDSIASEYDRFVNLFNTIEVKWLAMEEMPEYFMSSEHRRKKYGHMNYFDAMTLEAGFRDEVGKHRGELYYSENERYIVRKWIDKYCDNKFTVLINLNGSSLHKRFRQAKEVADKILDEFQDAVIITTGDGSLNELSFKRDRVINLEGKWPFRQAMCLTDYMNCVIGHESGLMIASNIHKTPTVQLMTCASIKSHADGAENDYSLQSPAPCSPCHKGPYKFIGCPNQDGLPVCAFFKVEDILNQVRKIHATNDTDVESPEKDDAELPLVRQQ